MAVMSMTGFARIDGADGGANWYWEIRSVNGRGLDVRVRLPTGAERIEVPARALVGRRLARGNVNLQLMQRTILSGTEIAVNEVALGRILVLAEELRARLGAPEPTVEGILALRGVLEPVETEESETVVAARMAAQLEGLAKGLDALVDARSAEGRRLGDIVDEQLQRIEAIVEAVAVSPARTPEVIAARLGELVRRLVEESGATLEPVRLYQEAVLLATKADVEEEVQRLRAHVASARDMLQEDGPIGRRLDFLAQEFNREANTLCSKSNDIDVTRLGLDLKSVIEQMREQVQNIE